MVRRFKVKTRGGKVVSKKKVKSFKSSSKKKTEQQQVEAAKKALEQVRKVFEKKGAREDIIKQVKQSSAKRAVKQVSEAFAQPGVRAKLIKQTQQIAAKKRNSDRAFEERKQQQERTSFKPTTRFFRPDPSILNRVERKKTITPSKAKEESSRQVIIQRYKDLPTSLQKINVAAKDLFVKVVKSPATYTKNLGSRKTKGEKTPLWNDLKEIKREIKAGTYDVGAEIGGLLGTATRKSVIGAFNYGKRIQREAQGGNFVIDDDVKKLIKTGFGGASTIATKTNNLRKFVQQNKFTSAVIAGAAVTSVGGALGKKFVKDPVEVTLQILLLKGVKVGSVASKTPIGRVILEEKFIRTQPANLRPFVRAIIKGAKAQERISPAKVKGLKKLNFNEVKTLKKSEASALAKTLKETDSFVFGSLPSRAISKGKTPRPHDVDLATKNTKVFLDKFIKNLPKAEQKFYTVKGERIIDKRGGEALLDIKGYDRLRPNQSFFGSGELPIYQNVANKGKVISLKESSLKIPTQPLQKIGGIKVVGFGEQTTRKGLGTLQVLIEKNGRRAKDPQAFIIGLKVQLEALNAGIVKSKIPKQYQIISNFKAKQLEKSIKLLESKSFSVALNKAVPGLTKEFPIYVKASKLSKVKTNLKTNNIINKIKTKLGIKSKTTKPKTTKTKTTKTKSTKTKTTKTKSTKTKTTKTKSTKPTKSKIPKSRIPKSRIPSSRVPSSRTPPSKPTSSRTPPSKPTPSRTPPSKPTPSRLPPSKPITSRLPTPSRLPPSKPITSRLPPPSRLPPSKPITSRTPPPRTPPKFIKLRLPTGLKKQGTRQAYIIKIKKGNKVIKQTVEGLPKVRATNLLRKILDTTPQTTGNLVSKGKTSILDTNKQILSKKFRMKKTKNTKTLQIVEKKKFRKDNVGEKTKKVKVIKKKTSKSITSKKKSSLKPSKKLKAKSKGKKAPTSKVNKKKK